MIKGSGDEMPPNEEVSALQPENEIIFGDVQDDINPEIEWFTLEPET